MVRHLSTVIFLLVFRSFRCGRDSRRPFEGNLPQNCTVPAYIQNKYYSRENGQNMFTTIQSNSFTRLRKVSIPGSIVETSVQRDTQVQETCLLMQCNRPNKVTGRCQSFQQTSDISGGIVYDSDRYRFLIHDTSTKCYRCREIAVRTINVLELRETECLTFGGNVVPDMTYLCGKLKGTKMDGNVERASWTTLFSQKPTRVSCRSSIEGSWTFKYSIQRYSQHKCLHPKNNLTSCPDPANRYSTEDRFYISYGACDDYAWKKGDPGLSFLRDMAMTFVCLGDWYIGNDHFFAAVNLGENRPEEQYRCFMENHDDDQYIGHSLAATCSTLLAPRVSPVMLHLFRAKTTTIAPSCSLPANFSGRWMNTAHAAVNSWIDINATHLLEKHRPDQRLAVETSFICQEQKGQRYMMARVGIGGCQVYYVCWHFLPRHHNIIRYRVGLAFATKDFRQVCSWSSFLQSRDWKYDLLIAQNPLPVECPIGGKFRFTQYGDVPLESRIRGGVTKSPRDQVECKQYETDLSVCSKQWRKQYDTRQILIDLDKCMTLDWHAKPIGEYDEPDHILHCIGYWRENARSFLVTYEKEDALSPFRCWVYNRIGYQRLLLSRGVASYCGIQQEPDSANLSYGASLALDLHENERLFDDCPLRFVDGSDPWIPIGQYGLLTSAAVLYRIASLFTVISNLSLHLFTVIFLKQEIWLGTVNRNDKK